MASDILGILAALLIVIALVVLTGTASALVIVVGADSSQVAVHSCQSPDPTPNITSAVPLVLVRPARQADRLLFWREEFSLGGVARLYQQAIIPPGECHAIFSPYVP